MIDSFLNTPAVDSVDTEARVGFITIETTRTEMPVSSQLARVGLDQIFEGTMAIPAMVEETFTIANDAEDLTNESQEVKVAFFTLVCSFPVFI